tara:strand:- start:1164 stop:2321 length:1158 start_codon:yes stop_codon:yes gene_type:complete
LKINIVRPILPNLNDIKKNFDKCLRTGLVTNNGTNVRNFEKNLRKFLKSKNDPVLFCNGQMAFYSLVQAWKFKLKIKNDEKLYAIVPSFTWSGTVNSLILNNITPIFCDTDDKFLLDLKKVENQINKFKKIRKKIKFIIPVSNYGNILNLNHLKSFCKKNKIIALMDSAPAFGSKYRNKYPNNYGFDEMYSFHATKIMTSMEGGCVVSNDLQITNYCKYIRDFGQYEKKIGNIKLPGLNSKMQEISAIVGNHNLKNFNKILDKRMKIIEMYKSFFQNFESRKIFSLMKVDPNVDCTYLYFPILVNRHIKKFKEYLTKSNISFRKYYSTVHNLEFYKKEKTTTIKLDLEFTNKIKDKVIALPIFSDMSIKEIKYIFSKINQFYKVL